MMPVRIVSQVYDVVQVRQHTKTGDEIVEHTPNSRLPAKPCVVRAKESDGGRDGEDGQAEVVQLLPPVVPTNGRQRLLVLDGPCDIVVGDIHVGRLLLLAQLRLLGRRGLGRSGVSL